MHLISLVGHTAARELIHRYGGLVLVVPKTVTGWLADLPGHSAERLAALYGGDRIYIPKPDRELRRARNRQIIAEYDAGERVQAIARRHRLTERQIWTILGRPVPEDPDVSQAELF